jgi:para-nitrobenzyl esterase
LFHRAILQSDGFEPSAAIPDSTRERVLQASARLFEQLGGSDIGHLREVPVDRVRQTSRVLSGTVPPPGQVHTPANLIWCPTIDGRVVGDDLSCWPADLPVLFGCTEHEARFFITPTGPYGAPGTDPAQIYTPETLANMAKVLGGQRADDILAHLPRSPYEALAELYTTAIWTEPAIASYRRFTDLGRTTYAYRFARVSPGNRRTGMLAHHCAELPYLFGHLIPAQQYDEVDAEVSNAIQHAWTDFARTGAPRNSDGTPWPGSTITTPLLTVIDDNPHSHPVDNSPVDEMIDSLRPHNSNR